MASKSRNTLSASQEFALNLLKSKANVFLTGAAGTGKSFLLQEFLCGQNRDKFPVLASTGVAAILLGGRTFHSFFGLGIFEGGMKVAIERALKNYPLKLRLQKTEGVVIDEVSMLSGPALEAAETVARRARGDSRPWGGLRVIAVGDFAQLPPVNPHSARREWAFLDPVWERTGFDNLVLKEVFRTQEQKFLRVLNEVRDGSVSEEVAEFLTDRTRPLPAGFDGTRLFARRENVENFNLQRLEDLRTPVSSFPTIYRGKEKELEKFKRYAPVPELLILKKGALVMFRQNDLDGRWVNGTLGTVRGLSEETLEIRLLNGEDVEVERCDFTLLDADGSPVVVANNFPLNLAWAVTIHKAQGATLDKAQVDLRRLWEPGQAYVALSRVRTSAGLFVEGWNTSSIIADPEVIRFNVTR